MTTLINDIKFALRMLGKNLGFTVTVVVILGIGIGATCVMLSVVDTVRRGACPYRDPETLACLFETTTTTDSETGMLMTHRWDGTSQAGFHDWLEQNQSFAYLVGADQWEGRVRTPERAERCRGYFVSPAFFSVLGIQPILGRTFLPEEHRQERGRVALLSHDHWRHWFGSDPNIVDKTLVVDKEPVTVVGVLPARFRWISQKIACGLWMPMPTERSTNPNRHIRGLEVIGRLKPGVTITQAQAEMDLVAERLAQTYPDTNADRGIRVTPINEVFIHYAALWSKPRILVAALTIAGVILLIACLHVSSLLIARSSAREQEIAVRAALGAQRLRLIRQLFTESVLLALLSGLLGLLLAYWALQLLATLRGQSVPLQLVGSDRLIPWFAEITMNLRGFLYIMGLSIVCCVTFGWLPALSLSKTNLNQSLTAGRYSGQIPRCHRLRDLLVGLDIAIAFVLLIGAGLMINSYVRILHIDPQVDTKNVVAAILEVRGAGERYTTPAQRFAFSQRLMDGIRNVPGVQAVAMANGTPAWRGYNADKFVIEGVPSGPEGIAIRTTPVSLDYFDLFRIPLYIGRTFTAQDTLASTPVAVITEKLAQQLWPNQNPLGRTLTHGRSERITREVVGVVREINHFGDNPDDEVFIPFRQTGGGLIHYPDLMIRFDGRSAGIITALRREIRSTDPEIYIRDLSSMDQQIADIFATERFNMVLLSAFAAVALVLASLGVYGATAYLVSRRTREIGIRIALGAQHGDVLQVVLHKAITLTLVGLSVGLVGAIATTRVIRNLLYDVSPTDPATFACVGLLLAGIAMLASYIPARRAARIDPMEALRYE